MADATPTTTTTTQTSPAPTVPPAAKAAAAVPAGDLYVFKPWHTALILTLAFLLDLPFRIDQMCGAYYPAPPTGGVLITGASSGIGRDAAVALATKEKGFMVFAGVRSSKDGKALSQLGLKNLVPVTLDVTSESSISSAYKAIMKDLGKKNLPFVGLVNNAGACSCLSCHILSTLPPTYPPTCPVPMTLSRFTHPPTSLHRHLHERPARVPVAC